MGVVAILVGFEPDVPGRMSRNIEVPPTVPSVTQSSRPVAAVIPEKNRLPPKDASCCGEELPPDVKDALTDSRVIKTAFNAQFERVCLSRYLGYPTGEYLDPEQWRCTMIWSAYLGLPLSLAGAPLPLPPAHPRS